MYIVFESYYKHGEVNMQLIHPNEMREFCLKQLGYYQVTGDFESLSLEELISLTIKEGNNIVEGQGGMGVRYIVKGDNITVMA